MAKKKGNNSFACQRCGRCCEDININVAYSDILRWAKEARYDILSKITYVKDEEKGSGFYIGDTITAPRKPCPFLEKKDGKASCAIQETKPRACKEAPFVYNSEDLKDFECPAKESLKRSESEAFELNKAQALDFFIAENKKDIVLDILRRVEAIGENIRAIKEFGDDPTESLWVDGLGTEKTDWTEVGASPFLDAQDEPTNVIYAAAKKARHGDFTFDNSAVGTGAINSVDFYIYSKYAGTGNILDIAIWDNDASGWQGFTVSPDSSYSWKSVDISGYIDNWSDIDAAKLYIQAENSADRVDVDAAYILVGYTSTETKTFVADAILILQPIKTFVADAILILQPTKTFTADAILSAGVSQYTKDFSADAVLILQPDKTFSADAILKDTFEKTFVADAILQDTFEITFVADAILKASLEKTFVADAILKGSIEKTFNADSILQASFEKTFNADAVLIYENTKTFVADAILKDTLTKDFSADAVLILQPDKTFSADAILQGTLTKNFSADAILSSGAQSYTKDFVADAILKASLEKTFNADAILKDTFEKTFNADAILQAVFTKTFVADAVLKGSIEKTFVADAILKDTFEITFVADAILQAALDKTFSADAILKGSIEKTFSADSILKGTLTKDFSADAYLILQPDKTFSADAILQGTLTKNFSADAVLISSNYKDFTADAILQGTLTKDFVADAILKDTFEKNFSADAVLVISTVKTFSCDAYLILQPDKTFSTDAILKGSIEKTFSADAVLDLNWTDISFDTTRYKDTSYFTFSAPGTEVTIVADGVYRLTARVTTSNSSATLAETTVEMQRDNGGAGYVSIGGTTGKIHNQTSTSGAGTCTITALMSLSAGDKIKVRAIKSAGTIATVAGGSSLTIERVRN